MHISRIRNESRIHVEDGNIHLKLSDSYPLKLSVDANEIVTDDKCSEHGKVGIFRETYISKVVNKIGRRPR